MLRHVQSEMQLKLHAETQRLMIEESEKLEEVCLQIHVCLLCLKKLVHLSVSDMCFQSVQLFLWFVSSLQ